MPISSTTGSDSTKRVRHPEKNAQPVSSFKISQANPRPPLLATTLLATTLMQPKEMCSYFGYGHNQHSATVIKDSNGNTLDPTKPKNQNKLQARTAHNQAVDLKRVDFSNLPANKRVRVASVVTPQNEIRMTYHDRNTLASCGVIINGHAHLGERIPAKFGGEFIFDDKELSEVNTRTGTYQTPGLDTPAGREVLSQLVDSLKQQGLTDEAIKGVHYEYFTSAGEIESTTIGDHWDNLSSYKRNETHYV